MEMKKIQELAELMQRVGLTKLEYKKENNEESLCMERCGCAAAPSMLQDAPAAVPAPVPAAPAVQAAPKGSEVLSPTVGVFYASPSPDSNPFVQVGDTVKKGDVLCIIEAMKLMNEIIAETDGTISDILVGNGQVVEYNQVLFRIV